MVNPYFTSEIYSMLKCEFYGNGFLDPQKTTGLISIKDVLSTSSYFNHISVINDVYILKQFFSKKLDLNLMVTEEILKQILPLNIMINSLTKNGIFIWDLEYQVVFILPKYSVYFSVIIELQLAAVCIRETILIYFLKVNL